LKFNNLKELIEYLSHCPICKNNSIRIKYQVSSDFYQSQKELSKNISIVNDEVILNILRYDDPFESNRFKVKINALSNEFKSSNYEKLKSIKSKHIEDLSIIIEAHCYNCIIYNVYSENIEFNFATNKIQEIKLHSDTFAIAEDSSNGFLLNNDYDSLSCEIMDIKIRPNSFITGILKVDINKNINPFDVNLLNKIKTYITLQ